MPFVALLGCDGSGKSAVISKITERFSNEGIAVTHGHWRPVAFPENKPPDTPHAADDPHGKPPHCYFKSTLKLGWLWLNWWTGWLMSLRAANANGLVLFDRFHGDLLVDPSRYRYGGGSGLAKLACSLMPQPDLVLFLDADPEILLSRKQEVTREALAYSRRKYLEFGKTARRFVIIDVNRPLDAVADDIALRIHLLLRGT